MRVATSLAPRLDEIAFCAWIAQAGPGDALAYAQRCWSAPQ